MGNDLILNPHGSPNGLETMSENLMLKLRFRDQVAPPLVEENDRPKIGASFGGPVGGPPSNPMNGGCPLTPGNGVVVGSCSTMKRFWISPLSIPFRTAAPMARGARK